jgi:hypothetical protein
MTRLPGQFDREADRPSFSLRKRRGSLLILLFSMVLLQGCLFDRLVTLRGQACSFDEYFAISIEQNLAIDFRSPVLLEKDLRLIWGAEPTTVLRSDAGATMRYLFERVPTGESDPKASLLDEFILDFEFTPVDGQLRLSKISSSDFPTDLLLAAGAIDFAGMDEIAEHACRIDINPFTRSMSLPLDRTWFSDLPARDELLKQFGSPNSISADGTGLVYEYRLKGDGSEPDIAKLVIRYDETGETPLTLEAGFNRYQMHTDLLTALLEVQFEI